MSRKSRTITIASHLYRHALRCCPQSRILDPQDMTSGFRSALAGEQQAHGMAAWWRFVLPALFDTFLFAIREWFSVFCEHITQRSRHRDQFGISRQWRLMTSLASFSKQLRFSTRSLLKAPVVSVAAILTLALAIGLTGATSSVVYSTLVRPLPFPGGERLMTLGLQGETGRDVQFEASELRDFRGQQSSFEALDGYFQRRVSLHHGDAHARSLNAAVVTATALDHLGVAPILGRTFRPGEDFSSSIQHVVLSHDVWRQDFAARRDVLGTIVNVDGRALEVIGVMPEGFRFPARESLWIPMDFEAPEGQRGAGRSFNVFGKLAENASLESATAEATHIAGLIAQETTGSANALTAYLTPFASSQLPRGLETVLPMLLAAVAGLLLIAGANVINLLIARAVTRSKETAILSALGARRTELVAPFLAESLLLSGVGAVLGLGMAQAAALSLQGLMSHFALPYWAEVSLDLPVMATVIVSAMTLALGMGLISAWWNTRSTRQTNREHGRYQGTRQLGRLGRGVVTAQVAISCALLIGAGLLIRSLSESRHIDRGFDADQVMTAEIRLPKIHFPDGATRSELFLSYLERSKQLLGVEAAALVRSPPGTGATFSWQFQVAGSPTTESEIAPVADGVPVSHGYFAAMGIPVLQGREFIGAESRAGSPPAVIVNRTMAERHLGDSPLGSRLRLSQDPEEPWLTVVGVVADSYIGTSAGGFGLDIAPREQIFISWGIAPYSRATLLLRSENQAPLALIPQAKELLAELAPGVSLDEPAHLGQVIDDSTWAFTLFGALFAIFGAAALGLSAVGLYGVSAFRVRQQRQEIGVRLALGASSQSLVRMIILGIIRQVAVGLAVGLFLGMLLANSLESLLFGVGALDPWVYSTIALAITGVSLLATLLSTRSIDHISPLDG